MMNRLLKEAALALGLALLLQSDATSHQHPRARRVLTVAAYPSVDAIIRAALPAWAKLHPDVDIHIISHQISDHHTAMVVALSSSTNVPDVMALEVGYIGRFSQGVGLEDLSREPFGAKKYSSQLVPYALRQAVNRRGELVAMPSDIGPGTLLYRKDLLDKAGVTEADLTRSWESYIAAGVRIKATTGAYLLGNAYDIKEIAIRSGIRPHDGVFFDSQSRVTVNTPRFRKAFELANEVREKKLDARVSQWSSDWMEGLKRGTIATQMTGAWLAGHLSKWVAPDTHGLWRAAPLPDGIRVAYGGNFYAIPRGSSRENKELAWEFIRLMTLEPSMQIAAFKAQDAFPALVETYDNDFFRQPIPFLGGQTARIEWREIAAHIQPVIVHRQDPVADEAVNMELENVLMRRKDIRSALSDAQRFLQQRAYR